jgi:3-phenylpropionate/cinnamic acid dioxygenase small subunit
MSDPADASTTLALRDLQYAYASAVDRRDPDALLAVFHADVVLRVFAPDTDEPLMEGRGREQLALMTEVMSQRYARTMHVMTNTSSSIDGDTATGEVYGVAHHLILDDGPPRKFVAYLRYDDAFGREPDGTWRITRRDIRFLWSEETPVLPWETAIERGRLA